MKWAKLNDDGSLRYLTRNFIVYNGRTYSNPSEALLMQAGWSRVPDVPVGTIATSWSMVDGALTPVLKSNPTWGAVDKLTDDYSLETVAARLNDLIDAGVNHQAEFQQLSLSTRDVGESVPESREAGQMEFSSRDAEGNSGELDSTGSVLDSSSSSMFPPEAQYVKLSKLKLTVALKRMGLYSKFLKWLIEHDCREEWNAAQEMRTDNEMFVLAVSSIRDSLGLEQAQVDQMLENCVLVED